MTAPVVYSDSSPDGLIDAVENNMAALFGRVLGAWPRAQTYIGDDIAWSLTDVKYPILNSTVRVRLEPEGADAAIRSAAERSRTWRVPVLWWITPRSQPDDIAQRLIDHGFRRGGDVPGMAIDLAGLPPQAPLPEGLSVEEVLDAETLDGYLDVLEAGFGFPPSVRNAFGECFRAVGLGATQPLRHFLVRLDQEPVATTDLLIAAGVAGIYNVATLEKARGRGIGSLVTAYALQVARSQGLQTGILQSSDMGFNVYKKLGFQQVCTFHHYVL